MRFVSKKGHETAFEISGIKKVVHTSIKVINGKKVKVGKAFIWELATTSRGKRWLKYEAGSLAALTAKNLPDAEFKVEARKLILDGATPEHMHRDIYNAMRHKAMHVWFSGETCNIENNLTAYTQMVMHDGAKQTAQFIKDIAEHICLIQRKAGL